MRRDRGRARRAGARGMRRRRLRLALGRRRRRRAAPGGDGADRARPWCRPAAARARARGAHLRRDAGGLVRGHRRALHRHRRALLPGDASSRPSRLVLPDLGPDAPSLRAECETPTSWGSDTVAPVFSWPAEGRPGPGDAGLVGRRLVVGLPEDRPARTTPTSPSASCRGRQEHAMKNPWMSLWLSAANRTARTARGHWLAEARRQQRALLKAAEKAMLSGMSACDEAGAEAPQARRLTAIRPARQEGAPTNPRSVPMPVRPLAALALALALALAACAGEARTSSPAAARPPTSTSTRTRRPSSAR